MRPNGLTRREWVRVAGLGSIALVTTACPPTPSPIFKRSASIPNIVTFNNIDGQRCLEWCWAACAETIVRQFNINVNGFFGTSVAQEYFAAKVFGGFNFNTCMGALPGQMAFALTDNYPLLGSSQRIALQGYAYAQNIPKSFNSKAVTLIKNQIPWSVLLVPAGQNSGHFLTVYAMEWSEDANGNVVSVDSYTMADPAQFLYPLFPSIPPYPKTFVAGLPYYQAGVVWAERVG